MIAKIICPSCQTMGQFSVEGGNYKGPYRCWKCRTLYTIDIENGEAKSWVPMAEKELEELKAKQDAEKRGGAGGVKSPAAAQPPSPPPQNPFVWPREQNKVTPEEKQPEPPKQSFAWPKMHEVDLNVTTPSSNAPFGMPSERPAKPGHGIILFQTIAPLAEAEKLLTDEGCSITRITAPIDPPSGSAVALRFPWSQYETVKAVLDKAGVKTQGIHPQPN